MKQTIVNEFGETVVTMESVDRGSFTDEELAMISRLDDFDEEYDEDCPAMPEAMIIQMQRDIESRRRSGLSRMAHTTAGSSTGAMTAIG